MSYAVSYAYYLYNNSVCKYKAENIPLMNRTYLYIYEYTKRKNAS